MKTIEYVMHSEASVGAPRVTVGAVLRPDDEGYMALFFGVSRCSEKDQFRKKLGRLRALGRACSSTEYIRNIQIGMPESKDQFKALSKKFVTHALEIIEENGGFPKEIKR
jgi:hypothetical protein